MIPIKDYQQFIAELTAKASQLSGVSVSKIRLAVTESQLTVLLKDQQDIVVCGNIPGMELSYPASFWLSEGECLLMVLEKMPEDEQGLEKEYDRFARLQCLMVEIVHLLTNADGFDRLMTGYFYEML